MRVKEAEYIEDYKIKVLFSDGVTKTVDFTPFLKNAKHVFLPLKDVNYFREFNVDDITLSWPNGADFDPELLYEMGSVVRVRRMKSSMPKKVSSKRTRIKKKRLNPFP